MRKTISCLFILLGVIGSYSQSRVKLDSEANTGNAVVSEILHSSTDGSADRPYVADSFGLEIPSGVFFGVFRKEDGPFLINGSVIVPAGQKLEFGPGCRIYIGGKYTTITVFGQIDAQGTKDEPVVFRSAYKEPNPWDWDRVYIRSRAGSTLRNCIVSHSNYGVYVENGTVSLEHCTFQNNSLHGMVITNSDAVLKKCSFLNGHVLALYCMEGSTVYADSLIIQNNITAIACTDQARVDIFQGTLSHNRNGIAVRSGASVSVVAADITSNKIGLISEEEISRRETEMVYDNIVDAQIVDEDEMSALLKQPEQVKSVVLPSQKDRVGQTGDLKAGFSARPEISNSQSSFIGNIEAGVGYYRPQSQRRNDTLVEQSKYPDGLQPEVTVFLQGKRGDADININADLYHNDWVDTETRLRKNMFAMAMTYEDQSFQAGDFYENSSETSIFGRKMTGIRYTGSFFQMGRGESRLKFKLAAGESEAPKDTGDHEPQIYNQVVDSGFSVRQQLTYLASLTYKPSYNSSIAVHGLIARDQLDKTLLGRDIFDPLAPAPTEAQTGCIEANVVLLDGALSVTAELNMGVRDTVDTQSYDEIAWYNPGVSKALPRVLGLIHPDSSNYAATLSSQGIFHGYEISGSFTAIAPDYFSAGSPYLENDEYTFNAGVKRRFDERLNASLSYEYERSEASNSLFSDQRSPIEQNNVVLQSEYSFGMNKPVASFHYALLLENNEEHIRAGSVVSGKTSVTSQHNKDVIHDVMIGVRQRFNNGFNYHLRCRLARENDYTNYVDVTQDDIGDSWYNELSGRVGFSIKRWLRNRSGFAIKYKTETQDSLHSLFYKFSNDVRITVIPRKLMLSLRGDYQKRVDDEHETGLGWFDTMYFLHGIDGQIRYSITPRISTVIKGIYEKVYDENVGAENYTLKAGGLYMTYLF
ncbi:MAG: right-handed parallel beta-helix repeat-containing protein [Fibrobacterota bacterium]